VVRIDEKLRTLASLALALCACGAIDLPLDAGAPPDSGGGDAGVTSDSGTAFDAGFADAGSHDGGSGSSDGGFCAPCADRSDCGGAPNLCLGAVGHCALDCSNGKACPAGASCTAISMGKAPPLYQCAPTVSACGTLSDAPPPSCPDGWAGYADGFFAQWCRGCHTQGFETAAEVHAGADGVRLAIDLGSMPRGSVLSAAERHRILVWLACGSSAPPAHH
jgi:hypothetical protein